MNHLQAISREDLKPCGQAMIGPSRIATGRGWSRRNAGSDNEQVSFAEIPGRGNPGSFILES
jgi:hypothetical protein